MNIKRNLLILGLAGAVLFSTHSAFAQATPAVGSVATTTDCFDYYKFGSVEVSVQNEIAEFTPGSTATFTGNIKNDNAYPIVDGSVYVKIFKKDIPTVRNAFGPAVVDQFVAVSGVNVPAHGKVPVTITWKVPTSAISGDYRLATFFESAKSFDLLGLSFTNDVVGNTADFAVTGGAVGTVAFDNHAVTLNNKPFYFVIFPPSVASTSTILAPLINSTKSTETVHVTWNVYSWSALNPSALIASANEDITLKPGEKKSSKYVLTDMSVPVYYVVATAEYKDAKSILDIRFVRNRVDRTRLNFLGLTSYPLRAGEPSTLFACAHGITQAISDGGKLVMSVKDLNGDEIVSAVYQGGITGEMMGFKKDFTPAANYENYTLSASLYQKGTLVDSVSLNYDCAKIDPNLCEKAPVVSEMNLWFIVLLVIVAIGFVVWFLIKRKKSGLLMMFLCVGIFGVGGFSNRAHAYMTLFSSDYTGVFYTVQWQEEHGELNWQKKLENPWVQIAYGATVKDITTNKYVIDRSSNVSVGDSIKFQFDTPTFQDIYWLGTGYQIGTPYGNWVANAGTPPNSICGDVSYFLINSDSEYDPDSHVALLNSYVSLSVNPPTHSITQSGTAGLDCAAASSDGSQTCTVTSEGTIKSSFNFGPTTAKFYHIWRENDTRIHRGDTICTTRRDAGNPVPAEMKNDVGDVPKRFSALPITAENIAVEFAAKNPVVITLPDLTAGAVTPNSAIVDSPVTLSALFSNVGATSTGAGFTNLFQKATDSNGTNATNIGTFARSAALSNGANFTATKDYTFTLAGTYYIRACADKSSGTDVNGTITESDETNNCSPTWTAVTVTAPAGATSSLTPVSQQVSSGSSATLTSNAINVVSCQVKSFDSGVVIEELSANASHGVVSHTTTFSNITGDHSYTLTCVGYGADNPLDKKAEITIALATRHSCLPTSAIPSTYNGTPCNSAVDPLNDSWEWSPATTCPGGSLDACKFTCPVNTIWTGTKCAVDPTPGDPLSCSASISGHNPAAFANVGQLVTWTSSPSNSNALWSEDNLNFGNKGSTYLKRYSTIGDKKVWVRVDSDTKQCSTGATDRTKLPIIFIPGIWEF